MSSNTGANTQIRIRRRRRAEDEQKKVMNSPRRKQKNVSLRLQHVHIFTYKVEGETTTKGRRIAKGFENLTCIEKSCHNVLSQHNGVAPFAIARRHTLVGNWWGIMDYQSEQQAEKESLSFLYEYTKEFININERSFKILIENKKKKISFYLLIEYTEKYPEDPPKYKIVDSNDSAYNNIPNIPFAEKNVTDTLRENVEKQIEETIENNLGYSMVYNIVENTYLSEDFEEKSMYDEMVARQMKPNEPEMDEHSDDDKKEKENYENVLELKELCEERYRVTDEEFDAWRKEFYKDIFAEIKNMNNSENPTGRELFEKGKINLLDTDFDEGEAKWCNEELFCDIDLNI
ncbi:hypothetical protein POVCU1_007590 [Plasmodium ovale curtisi]|uniref:RWD domain-containing protein n=1 Tax=Plasmodium ovale curtisi TaxID=864141 RepID=A0A1A8VPV9_PLAOA|nr:hypothetical protein POVCU1_007590 [Plasmodium ovale curtisi]